MFGEIIEGEMQNHPFGEIVQACWQELPNHYSHLKLGTFVVMPNHIHGILHLIESELLSADFVGAGLRPASTGDGILPVRRGVSEILRALKSFSSRWINEFRGTPGVAVWQRNYYERIIRDEEALSRIQKYILTNPLRWWCDRENPAADSADDFDRWLETQGENPIRRGRL